MSQPSAPPNLILSQRLSDGRVIEVLLEPGARVRAADEAAYAVIDLEEAEAPAVLAALRRGEDLVVEVGGAEVLVLEGFFTATDVAFHPTTNLAGGVGLFSGAPLTPDSPVRTVSAAGEPVWTAAQVDGTETEPGGSPMLIGGLVAGGLGLALAAGGGGGGGGSSPAPDPTPTPQPSSVTGTVVGGPVIAGNGLTVDLFAADGSTALGSAKVAADGGFTIEVGDYTGVVVARVVDADAGDDYRDEATAADRDLNAALGAVATVTEPGSTVVVNVNPLTTLAAALAAREAAGATPTAAEAAAAHAAVADLFGLSDLHAVSVVPINGGAYDAADGLSAGERYGAILAAFSGADLDNGGDSQQTLDTVLAGLSVASDGTATLSESVQALLVQGAGTTETATGVALGDLVASVLDSVAPQITSGAMAAAVDENSGAGQVVYTATATDASTVTFSLAPGGDGAAFTIDTTTGAVTLTADPDFETQASYGFTVVATDAAGNNAEQPVTLEIIDVDDEIGPSVSSVALTGADGARNDTLNAGDSVTVTVTMSEATDVDTSGGVPRIALNVGGSTVFAGYVSGSGSTSLLFSYTVQPGDRDGDGISIPADGLDANGGALADGAGNAASLTHGPVPSDPAFAVDTAAPTLSGSTPADDARDVAVDSDVVLTFSENVIAGSGTITISRRGGSDDDDDDDEGGDSFSIDVTDASQVSISGSQVTIDPAADLDADSRYVVRIERGALTDEAGNAYGGIRNSSTLNFATERGPQVDTSVVVFDLLQGSSSDHSGRSFERGVSYDIFIRVDSSDSALSSAGGGPGTWGTWAGTANLGSDDRILLVGNGAAVDGPFAVVDEVSVGGQAVAWESAAFGFDAGVVQGTGFTRATGLRFGARDRTTLFETSLPGAFLGNQGGQLATMYLTAMPAGILTSQGLV